jgi:hypothetical protein
VPAMFMQCSSGRCATRPMRQQNHHQLATTHAFPPSPRLTDRPTARPPQKTTHPRTHAPPQAPPPRRRPMAHCPTQAPSLEVGGTLVHPLLLPTHVRRGPRLY